MLNEAQDRLHDAEVLAKSGESLSDAIPLLRILALEVLLKAAQVACFDKCQWGHDYLKLWSSLPQAVRTAVLDVAHQQYPGRADLSGLDGLFKDWEFAFKKGRYYFELYEGYSLDEQRAFGELWVSNGAPIQEAAVRYHPLELMALAQGLIAYIEAAP